ncbi:MAG: hypothetical protein ACTSRZ_11395, partial [Promethearchaeota archaeon]
EHPNELAEMLNKIIIVSRLRRMEVKLEEVLKEMELEIDPKELPLGKEVYKEGLLEGRKEGREEGRKEGREEGRKEGKIEALKNSIIKLIQSKFAKNKEDLDQIIDKINTINDYKQLDDIFNLSLTMDTFDEFKQKILN